MTLRSLTAALLRVIQTNSGISQPALLLHKVHGWHTQGAKIPQAQKKGNPRSVLVPPGVASLLYTHCSCHCLDATAIAFLFPPIAAVAAAISIASIAYAITHGAHPLRAIMPCAE